MTHVSLNIAKRLHEEKRPFKVSIQLTSTYLYDTPPKNKDGEPVTVTYWSSWIYWSGEFKVFHGTNLSDSDCRSIDLEEAFESIKNHLERGDVYVEGTEFTMEAARPMCWADVSLIYKKIAHVVPHEKEPTVLAYDKDGGFIMELTIEGLQTLRAFNYAI